MLLVLWTEREFFASPMLCFERVMDSKAALMESERFALVNFAMRMLTAYSAGETQIPYGFVCPQRTHHS